MPTAPFLWSKAARYFLSGLVVLGISSLVALHVMGVFGNSWWIFDLANHFRLQYLIVSLPLALAALVLKQPKWAIISALIFIFNLIQVGVFYAPGPKLQATNSPQIKIMFSNILISARSDERVGKLIQKEQPDIVFLAEIRKDVFDQLQKRLGDSYQVQEYRQRFSVFGMAVFSKLPFENNDWELLLTSYLHEDPLPSFSSVVKVGDTRLRLIEIHPYHPLGQAQTEARNETLIGVADYLEKNRDIPTLIIGDFNSTSWSRTFMQMQRRGQLTDSRLGRGLQPSWPVQLPECMRISIDHALYTPGIQVHDRYLGSDIGSDHLPFFITVSMLE